MKMKSPFLFRLPVAVKKPQDENSRDPDFL